jgi:hypothetical protein
MSFCWEFKELSLNYYFKLVLIINALSAGVLQPAKNKLIMNTDDGIARIDFFISF